MARVNVFFPNDTEIVTFESLYQKEETRNIIINDMFDDFLTDLAGKISDLRFAEIYTVSFFNF